ncbi:hypothetical protein GGR58DRAFT_515919 [Xylaria digitata]|nr:hypothetical protein GGR58DRAFT_515919 [Xylaria digitata]
MADNTLYILNESTKNATEQEAARLELQHRFFDNIMNNELLPPHITKQLAENPSPRVCEIATGTAIWLKELAGTLPASAELVGLDFDVSKFPEPEALPSNIRLDFVDVYKPFPEEFQNRFDVVHLRHFILATQKDHGVSLVRNWLSLLRPGGWLVWVETGFPLASAEPPSQAMFQAQQIYYKFIKAINLDIDVTLARASYMRQAGLVDCDERSYNCGSVLFGPKASGWLAHEHDEFVLTLSQILKGILAKGVVDGMRTRNDLIELVGKLREELSGMRRLHMPVIRVWGQKSWK